MQPIMMNISRFDLFLTVNERTIGINAQTMPKIVFASINQPSVNTLSINFGINDQNNREKIIQNITAS